MNGPILWGQVNVICARKSTLRNWIEIQEGAQ